MDVSCVKNEELKLLLNKEKKLPQKHAASVAIAGVHSIWGPCQKILLLLEPQ